MATLVNDSEREQDESALDDFAAEEVVETKEEDVPEKYRGKSAADLVRMHQEAESLAGRHSNEVGELRKVVDDFITKQTELNGKTEEVDDEIDYFANPKEAISRAIEKHPSVLEAKQASKKMAITETRAALMERHPQMGEYFQDPKFAEWIQSSQTRTKRLRDANEKFDYEAADDIFTQWEERQELVKQAMQHESVSRKAVTSAASTGSVRSSGGNTGGAKIYRRMDIIKLMREDPVRYEKLSPEIRKAYAEGRVK